MRSGWPKRSPSAPTARPSSPAASSRTSPPSARSTTTPPTRTTRAWIIDAVNWGDPNDPDLAEGDLTSIAYCIPSTAASKVPYAQRRAAALKQAAAIGTQINKRR